jgi:hypothetical protein
MEDVVLGTKRTIPFWQPKRRLLSLARALVPGRQVEEKNAVTTQALASARARDRLEAESKKKGRFAET